MEIWKNIDGYPKYMVSNKGRVKSLDYNGTKQERILKPTENRKGYLRIGLYRDKKYHSHVIHRLVAKAFIENTENKDQVNHIDGNKKNNDVSNLEWCDNRENQIHAYKIGLNKHIRPVAQFDKCGNFIKAWGTMTEAAATLGIDLAHLQRACKIKSYTAGGYVWRYREEALL